MYRGAINMGSINRARVYWDPMHRGFIPRTRTEIGRHAWTATGADTGMPWDGEWRRLTLGSEGYGGGHRGDAKEAFTLLTSGASTATSPLTLPLDA